MPIPDYQSLMLPLLKAVQDGNEYTLGDVEETIATQCQISPEERDQRYPSGNQKILKSRITWAGTYLKNAKILESDVKGKYKITERGLQLMSQTPAVVNNALLMQYPEFAEYAGRQHVSQAHHKTTTEQPDTSAVTSLTLDPLDPLEAVARNFQSIHQALGEQLLELIKQSSPRFFEMLVVDLLVTMGYGGSHQDIWEAVKGKSGDEGIDGLIKEDKLGLEEIYIQAKRWTSNTVGRPDIQGFVGSLEGFRARKGVFFTASSFTQEARRYIEKIGKKIILIDGQTLVELMIEHNVGVSPKDTYVIKQINSDYFEQLS